MIAFSVQRPKKEVTFVYQKLLLFLSIAKAMAYHHALACISSPQAYIINRRLYRFRNDDIQNCVLMIYRNKLRMIYKAHALIYLPKCDIINSLIIGIKRRTIAEIKKGVLVLYVE